MVFDSYQEPSFAYALNANSSYQDGELDYSYQDPVPPPSPVLLHGSVSTTDVGGSDSGSIWSKIGSGLSKLGTGLAHLAEDALPYEKKAVTAFANTPLSPIFTSNFNAGDDFSLSYSRPSIRSIRSNVVQRLATPVIKTPTVNIGQTVLNRIQSQRSNPLQNVVKINQMAANSHRILNAVANTQGLPTYQQFHQQNGVVYQSPSSPGNLGIQDYLNNTESQPSPGWIPQQTIPITGTQQPRNTEIIPLSSGDPLSSFTLPNMEFLPKAEYQNRAEGKINLWQKLQNGQVLSDAEMKQLFHSLDLQQAQSKTAIEKINAALARVHAEKQLARNMAANVQRDADGNVRIQGVSGHSKNALAFAKQDIQHFQKTNTHLSPQQDWKSQLAKTASGFWKGVANGAAAGAGPKASRGEEGAYTVGDLLGTVGVNLAALETGPFAPAVWTAYGAAREANRETDAGKPLNPAAIAASGALNAIPGTTALKVPLGTVGRVGVGLTTGYASDIANRGVQQLGDTGRITPSRLDYRPGLGTVTGGAVGLLSHPAVSQAFQKYLLDRQAQLLNGEKVPVSLEDFLAKVQQDTGWSNEELAFYLGQSSTPPIGSRYDRQFWSEGYNAKANKSLRPIENAFSHAKNHSKEFGLPQKDPYYIERADDTIPSGSHVKVTADGKQYLYDDATDTLYIREPNGTPKSMFKPGRGNTQKGWVYFLKQPGEYKGRLP